MMSYFFWKKRQEKTHITSSVIYKAGFPSFLFLIGYGFFRLLAEFFRLPDVQIGYLFGSDWITLGMIYTLPIFILAIWVYRKITK